MTQPAKQAAGSPGALLARVSAGRLCDAIFDHIANKESYDLTEVDRYRHVLKGLKDASALVAATLARLLDAAGGDPAQVPWILKVIGQGALAEIGGPDAIPVLRRYEGDPGG